MGPLALGLLVAGQGVAQELHTAPTLSRLEVVAAPIPEGPPREVSAAPGAALQTLVASLPAGSTLRLDPGVYAGPLTLERPMTLVGPGARLLGPGRGSVLMITADDVTVSGLEIAGGGHSATDGDAGVIVVGDRVKLEDLHVHDTLVGVDLRQADHGELRGLRIEGDPTASMGMRGDGIRLWESDHNRLTGNVLDHVRDLVVWYSEGNTITDNELRSSRYGVHFMHSDGNVVERNRFEHDVVGVFVMYSTDITLRDNVVSRADGAAGMGLGCKESDRITVDHNRFLGNTTGIYLDGCPHRIDGMARFTDNLVAYNHVGLRFHSAHAGASFTGNDLHENGVPVSVDGGGDAAAVHFDGNRWSDYEGYDLDGDGHGDLPYTPRRFSRQLVERRPVTTFFTGTPASMLLDFLASVFPMWAPTPVLEDAHPRMGRLEVRPLATGPRPSDLR